MTYEEARKFIQESNRYGIVLGLGTMTELLNRLGNPQDQLRIIHVAGTNGKGSTSTFITSILNMAGYKVGRYISPAVFCYEEKIQVAQPMNTLEKNRDINVDGIATVTNHIDYITKEGICKAIERIWPICEAMHQEGLPHPTSFEIETAMAFLYLLWEKVDLAVIEVGMGGVLDATNVIKQPICSVITSISMDHMNYLGSTLQEIAIQKAGIIKYECPVVTCRQKPAVQKVLEQISRDRNAGLNLCESDQIAEVHYSPDKTTFLFATDQEKRQYSIRMLGEYQVGNACLAITVARVLQRQGLSITEAAIDQGLIYASWSGRFEIIAKNPYVIIDGAHNEAAAISLRNSVELYFTNRRIIYMIGVLADKDYKSILKLTVPLADLIITLTPDNNRALSSRELTRQLQSFGKPVMDAGTVSEAVRMARSEAGSEDVIIAFGSLSFLGDLRNSFLIRKEDETYDR